MILQDSFQVMLALRSLIMKDFFWGSFVWINIYGGREGSDIWHRERLAAHPWTDAVRRWCWRRLLRVPWTEERPNQSVLKEINPEYSLEGLMMKLMLQYFGHPIWRADSLEKTLMLGKIEGGRRRGLQRMRWLDSITDSMDRNLSQLQEIAEDREAWRTYSPWGHQESDTTKAGLSCSLYNVLSWPQGVL